MNYSIMLYFNTFSNYRIATYIDLLDGCSNNRYFLDSKIPPHMTIGMWNSEDNFLDEIKELTRHTKPFEISLASLGIFNNPNDKAHVFLAPVKSPELVAFHKNFYDHIHLHEGDEFDRVYEDNNIWVPHVTIGYEVEKKDITKAIEECSTIELPQKALVCKIAVAHCCPFQEIEIIELST
ncbi:MAG: 2'-5' RNA ligase family protein [Clostridiales bacterium]|nr:2'-5' RNA ligase family protein [Clostridiales bacterium]